jgi:hypothetical protein
MRVDVKDAQFKPVTITLESQKDVETIKGLISWYLSNPRVVLSDCGVDEWHTIDCLGKMLG